MSPSYEHRREANATVPAIQPPPMDSHALKMVSYLQYSIGIANPEPQPTRIIYYLNRQKRRYIQGGHLI
jgi:hypothetical protein